MIIHSTLTPDVIRQRLAERATPVTSEEPAPDQCIYYHFDDKDMLYLKSHNKQSNGKNKQLFVCTLAWEKDETVITGAFKGGSKLPLILSLLVLLSVLAAMAYLITVNPYFSSLAILVIPAILVLFLYPKKAQKEVERFIEENLIK